MIFKIHIFSKINDNDEVSEDIKIETLEYKKINNIWKDKVNDRGYVRVYIRIIDDKKITTYYLKHPFKGHKNKIYLSLDEIRRDYTISNILEMTENI